MVPNKIIDHHMHTNYSPDANQTATIEAYIEKAKTLNLTGLMITDHADLETPVDLFQTLIDYDAYYQKIVALRKTVEFPIYMGIEVGYQPHLNKKLDNLLNQYPFDFVISSIHLGDGLDFYNNDFFIGKTQEEGYRRYFEICLEAVQSYQNYDVFGHLDYIIRYGGFENKSLDFSKYSPLIDEILKTIIKNNKGIEVNTSGLRYGLGVMHPMEAVVKRYKALGGTIITLGSDAHNVEDITADFDKAIDVLKRSGFNSITQFKNRKPYYIEI